MEELKRGKEYLKYGLKASASFIGGFLIFAAAMVIVFLVIFALNGFSLGSEYEMCLRRNAKTGVDSVGRYTLIDSEVENKCLGIDD